MAAYEQLLESSIGKQVRNALDRVGAPDCLRLIKESSDDAILNLGVFWPVPVFVAEEGKEPNPEDLTDFVFHGKKLRGVYRSKTCGEPPGTITRGAGQHEKILQIRDLAPEKASEGFKKIADQTVHGHSVTMKKDDATGEASYMPVQTKTKLKAADGDDELDWSDILTTGGKSTVTYEDSSSDTDSSPKRKKKKKKAAKSPAKRINSKWMTGQRKEATPKGVKKTVPKTSPKTSPNQGKATKTLYASHQIRLIMNLEQSTTEATSYMSQGANDAGFLSLAVAKLESLKARIQAKLQDESKIADLQCANSIKEGNDMVCLQYRGTAAVASATKTKELLGHTITLVTSYKASGADELANSASFLARAASEARCAGVTVLPMVYEEIVYRHCRQQIGQPNGVANVSTALDANSQMQCGSSILIGTDEQRKEVQDRVATSVVCDILGVQEASDVLGGTGDLQQACELFPKVVTSEPFSLVCGHIVTIMNEQALSGDLKHAIEFLCDPRSTGQAFAKSLQLDRPQALISKARDMLVQRVTDIALQADVTSVNTAVGAVNLQPAGQADDVLVTHRFDAETLGKLRIKFESIMQKASSNLLSSRQSDITDIRQKLTDASVAIPSSKIHFFWKTIRQRPLLWSVVGEQTKKNKNK